MSRSKNQLSLFGEAEAPRKPRVRPAEIDLDVQALASRLPPTVRLGTSSWSFPGWVGLVYGEAADQRRLARDGLEAYGHHPLLRTVGVDRSYYAPLSRDVWARYAESVPDDFRFLAKAHDWVTTARFPSHRRYGDRAGQRSAFYLDAAYATDEVVGPFVEGLGAKAGPLVFQFAPQPLDELGGAERFADELGRFVTALPRGPLYAVEIRNASLLTDRYVDALTASGAVHCLNGLPGMPDVARQGELARSARRRALVVRWMLRNGWDYGDAREAFRPFDRLVEPDPARRGAIARLVHEALDDDRPAFVVINNKAEGSAPLSAVELAKRIVG